MARKIKGRTRVLFVLIALIVGYFALNQFGVIQGIKFRKSQTVEGRTNLPSGVRGSGQSSTVAAYQAPGTRPIRSSKEPIRVQMMTWQSQFAVPLANGGALTTEGSLVAKYGSYVEIVKQEDCFQMRSDMIRSGQVLSQGGEPDIDACCIMGDYTATFLTPLNDELAKLGQHASVYYSFGRSLGEDKVMVTPEIAADHKKLLGAIIIGVAGDGDINILLNFADDNKSWCKVNPELGTWEEDAVNIYNCKTYEDAGKIWIAGGKVQVINKKTGKTEWRQASGLASWTPVDENVARMRGGLVNLVSTKDYANQMPNAMIAIDSYVASHLDQFVGFCAATSDASDIIANYPQAYQQAGALFAQVFQNQDGAYWCDLFKSKWVTDVQGNRVTVGGSMTHNIADNQLLFGLQGGTNVFDLTYTRHGQFVVDLWPDMLPKFPPAATVINSSVIDGVTRKRPSSAPAQIPDFSQPSASREVVSRSDWKIEFQSGSAELTPQAIGELRKMAAAMINQSTTRLELHCHTDANGSDEYNDALSARRGETVKAFLENYDRVFFSVGRIKVVPHGEREPLVSGDTPRAYAANRRVELVTIRG